MTSRLRCCAWIAKWPLAVVLALSLLGASSAQARVTCQLQNATTPANPFTITSNVEPFGGTVYTRTTLNVTCLRDDNRDTVDIEIGASNTKGGTSPRLAILTTNPDWGIGYALTHGGGCASNTSVSNWLEYGTTQTFKASLTFNGNSASLSVPACLTVGHSNNVAYRTGLYQDNVRFTLAYQEWLVMPGVTTSIDMLYRVNVSGGCRISQNPSDLALVYSAFSATDNSASTTLGLTCNPDLPWSAALSATDGLASSLGLPYRLALSAHQGTGRGVQQGIGITATIPRGLAGVCPSSQCRDAVAERYTLTISY
jgi:hypothetical protein